MKRLRWRASRRQFLFVFEPPEKDSITTTVFSTPDFVMQAVAALCRGGCG